MALTLEADVALLHIAGGGARVTPPPGTLAQTAPRRAARGRREDMLFITLGLISPRSTPPGLIDHLARLTAQAYFGTPGSVTFALREAAAIFNDHILDANEGEDEIMQLQGHMVAGVLRGKDLYIAQCGNGQAIIVRPGQVTLLSSEEAANRSLGSSLAPYVRYSHLEVNAGDLLILTTSPPPIWSDATLSGLSTLDPAQAVDRLVAVSGHDLTGVLARIVPYGKAIEGVQRPPIRRPSRADTERAPQAASTLRRAPSGEITRRTFESTNRFFSSVKRLFGGWLTTITNALMAVLTRLAPGLAEPPQIGAFTPGLMATTAVAVPLLVVTIAAVAYFGRGRKEQFQDYYSQAYTAVLTAQTKPDPDQARGDWAEALRLLDMAETYGHSKEADDLRELVQSSLDTIDLVVRLDFQTVVPGGFGSDAKITALAASATDLYVLDATQQIIWHAWGAPERGYEIDKNFDCLNGPDSFPEMSTPVDIVIQTQPGALGVEGLVAVDNDGTLLYCAPDRQPALAQLTPPDIGWRLIQAIDVFSESLYIMDTEANAVYIYDAAGGLFSGNPELYFVEEVRELSGAIDLAMAGDELIILYADGKLDRCRRKFETDLEGKSRIRVECDAELYFEDDRPGHESTTHIPGAVPIAMAYSAPPEPSLFFLDSLSNSVFHYSMRLVYQGQYFPLEAFEEEITALGLGPPNDLFIAVGDEVYHAQPQR
ncbi:MAG: protein phosphatase 2C family protein [Anaerolineaceae bacterium]|nr:MAG: protein phosphatase 2C family protein [Anaerolineaceae bacterium]